MLVVYGLADVPPAAKGAALAIGNFDGVHRGHQTLIAAAVVAARAAGAPAGVMLFEPHPREYFHPEEPHFPLTPLPEKLRLLAGLGIDAAIVVPFDAAFAALTAEEFIRSVVAEALGARHVVIGYDFFFGHKRGGSPDTMRAAGARHGFGVTVISPVAEDGEVFSSSAIRTKLAEGDIKGAAHSLGRAWRVSGPIVGGAHRGAGLGFPTANVPLPKGTALAHGIYAVRASLGGRALDGAAYLGTRPMFDDGMPVLEVFLFDFDGDIYGKELSVDFIDFIRPDRKFDNVETLKAQMAQDCAKARTILATGPPLPVLTGRGSG